MRRADRHNGNYRRLVRTAHERLRENEAALTRCNRYVRSAGVGLAADAKSRSATLDIIRGLRRTRKGRNVGTVSDAMDAIEAYRETRSALGHARLCIKSEKRAVTDRYSRRYAQRAESLMNRCGRPAALLRDILHRTRAFKLRNLIESGTHGTTEVVWTGDLGACGVSTERRWDSTIYKGRYKGWGARIVTHTVTAQNLPPCALPGGHRDWHGLVTLGAEIEIDRVNPRRGEGEIRVWRAVWARHGRGLDWRTEHGWIAVTAHPHAGEFARPPDPIVTHSVSSAGAAIRTLRRRLRAAEADHAARYRTASGATLADHASDRVTLADARAVGACRPGIEAFVDRWFPTRTLSEGATVGELLATGDPIAEAAARHAIARAGH